MYVIVHRIFQAIFFNKIIVKANMQKQDIISFVKIRQVSG